MPVTTLTQTPGGEDFTSPSFRNQWLNFTLYFLQFKYRTKKDPEKSKFCAFLLSERDRLKKNDKPIGGNQRSTQFLANGKYFKTDFIQVDKQDLLRMMYDYPEIKGYSYRESELRGTYRSKETNTDNKLDGVNPAPSGIKHFFRGLYEADCLQFLVKAGII